LRLNLPYCPRKEFFRKDRTFKLISTLLSDLSETHWLFFFFFVLSGANSIVIRCCFEIVALVARHIWMLQIQEKKNFKYLLLCFCRPIIVLLALQEDSASKCALYRPQTQARTHAVHAEAMTLKNYS